MQQPSTDGPSSPVPYLFPCRAVPLLTAWLGMWPALIALTVAAGGVWATHGPLFSWPAAFLEQEAGALAFALMKTCGALGGFTGPLVVGLLADKSGHGFAGAMLLLAVVCAGTAVAVAGETHSRLEQGLLVARQRTTQDIALFQ